MQIEERRHTGVLGLALAIAIGVVLGGVILSTLFWVVGVVFHLLVWGLRVAFIVALAALAIWAVGRFRSCRD